MKYIRIIPRLDIKGPNLIKGIHLEGLRVLGKPEQYAKFYYTDGADELMFQDVVASLYERNSLHDIIQRIAKEIFIPLTVGGGIRSIEDVRSVLRSGADKVSINTAAVKTPNFISEAANIFGSSTIVVAIELIKQSDGNYLAFTDNGREKTGREVIEWAKEIETLGAGEIVLTSVDREGTGQGLDLELIEKVAKTVSVPIIVHGGVAKMEDVKSGFESGANAIAIASMFHYFFLKNHNLDKDLKEGNLDFMKSGQSYSKVNTESIQKLKKFLKNNKIQIRE
jgi:cyclase